MTKITLRDVSETDLPVFFEQELDEEAIYMAAFTPKDATDKAAFDEHWAKILGNEAIIKKTILYEGQVAGNILSFELFGEREVCYWLGRAYWGRGIATAALTALLAEVSIRPLYARVVKDNLGSLRVLQKCGFTIIDEDVGFANGRGEEVAEFILKLKE